MHDEMKALIPVLARHMDGAAAAAELAEPLEAHLGEGHGADAAASLQAALQEIVDEDGELEPGWARVLKCARPPCDTTATMEAHRHRPLPPPPPFPTTTTAAAAP